MSSQTLDHLSLHEATQTPAHTLDVSTVNRAIGELEKKLNRPGQEKLKGEILAGLTLLAETESSIHFSENARHLFEAYEAASRGNTDKLAQALGLEGYVKD